MHSPSPRSAMARMGISGAAARMSTMGVRPAPDPIRSAMSRIEGFRVAQSYAARPEVSASPTTSKSGWVASSETSDRRSSGNLSATTIRIEFEAALPARRGAAFAAIFFSGGVFRDAAFRLRDDLAAVFFLTERATGFRAVDFRPALLGDFLVVRATVDLEGLAVGAGRTRPERLKLPPAYSLEVDPSRRFPLL